MSIRKERRDAHRQIARTRRKLTPPQPVRPANVIQAFGEAFAGSLSAAMGTAPTSQHHSPHLTDFGYCNCHCNDCHTSLEGLCVCADCCCNSQEECDLAPRSET